MDFKAPHLHVPESKEKVTTCARYPTVGIAEWHKKHGLYGTYTGDQQTQPAAKRAKDDKEEKKEAAK